MTNYGSDLNLRCEGATAHTEVKERTNVSIISRKQLLTASAGEHIEGWRGTFWDELFIITHTLSGTTLGAPAPITDTLLGIRVDNEA